MSTQFSNDGDPGKLAYLRNPNFTAAPMSQISRVDPRLCPACIFPYARKSGTHVDDCRCALWRKAHSEHEHTSECLSRKIPVTTPEVLPVSRPEKVGMRLEPSTRQCASLETEIQGGKYV